MSCHLTKIPFLNYDKGVYGISKDNTLRSISSSGGGFGAVIEALKLIHPNLEMKVFGSVFDSNDGSVYQRSYGYDEYRKLCQSKYVISDTRNTFEEVKDYLEKNIFVVYTGTPCQIAALKTFLNKNYELLFTIDFICHGVPSEQLFQEHLSYIAGKRTVSNVEFRSKAMGWRLHGYCMKISFSNGDIYLKKASKDFYFSHFLRNDCLRESCYHCKYSHRHVSDVTLGDFWEVVRYDKSFDDQRGVSVLFFNHEISFQFKNALRNLMVLHPLPESYSRSHCGCNPLLLNEQVKFMELIQEKNINEMEKKFIFDWVRSLSQRILKKL